MSTDKLSGLGMSDERYNELMNNLDLKLTEGEIRVGWLWCRAFDGLLIHKSWKEYEYCKDEDEYSN